MVQSMSTVAQLTVNDKKALKNNMRQYKSTRASRELN